MASIIISGNSYPATTTIQDGNLDTMINNVTRLVMNINVNDDTSKITLTHIDLKDIGNGIYEDGGEVHIKKTYTIEYMLIVAKEIDNE